MDGVKHRTGAIARGQPSFSAVFVAVDRRPEGDYAVRRADSKRASAVVPTQKEAIEKARQLNPGVAPRVEGVRNTKFGKRDRWRKA